MSTRLGFGGARPTGFQAAVGAFEDEPMRTRTTQTAVPGQEVGVGFHNGERVSAATGRHGTGWEGGDGKWRLEVDTLGWTRPAVNQTIQTIPSRRLAWVGRWDKGIRREQFVCDLQWLRVGD